MESWRATPDASVVVLIDLQPSFMKTMPETPGVMARSQFLSASAQELDIPILITEQYPSRMGGTSPELLDLLDPKPPIFSKMSFGACDCHEFMLELDRIGRHHVILAGCETHICVAQTALGLLDQGYHVTLASDAICGRGSAATATALRRMSQAGAIESHTESIVYEWMQTAQHPRFKNILNLVKQYSV